MTRGTGDVETALGVTHCPGVPDVDTDTDVDKNVNVDAGPDMVTQRGRVRPEPE